MVRGGYYYGTEKIIKETANAAFAAIFPFISFGHP